MYSGKAGPLSPCRCWEHSSNWERPSHETIQGPGPVTEALKEGHTHPPNWSVSPYNQAWKLKPMQFSWLQSKGSSYNRSISVQKDFLGHQPLRNSFGLSSSGKPQILQRSILLAESLLFSSVCLSNHQEGYFFSHLVEHLLVNCCSCRSFALRGIPCPPTALPFISLLNIDRSKYLCQSAFSLGCLCFMSSHLIVGLFFHTVRFVYV